MAGESAALLYTVPLALGVGQLVALINQNDDLQAKAIAGYHSVSVAGSSNYTLSTSEYGYGILVFTGVLTGNIAVIAPLVVTRKFTVVNNTTGAFTLTVRTSTGTGAVVVQGTRVELFSDGVDVYTITPSGAGDFSSSVSTSVDSEIVLFSGTTGKIAKRATGTGLAAITAGVLSAIASSASLAAIITDETGTGFLVFATSPTLTTPTINGATLNNATVLTIKDVNLVIQDDGDTTKQLKFQLSGLTTATTRTLTVPDASDTLAVLALAQTLTNKTLDNTTVLTIKDTNFTIQDDADVTKQIKFQLSGLTTGVTRTFTLPDLSDTLVTLTATQTLTNKRVTPRFSSLADATSITPTGDTVEMNTHVNTQAVGTLTVNAPSGTPTDGQMLILRIKSTNVQTYAFNAIYRFSGDLTAPTVTTGGSKTDYLLFRYNIADTTWDYLSKIFNFG